MKIECTKKEWLYLRILLLENHNSDESYKDPDFIAFFENHNEPESIIRIEGKFTDGLKK